MFANLFTAPCLKELHVYAPLRPNITSREENRQAGRHNCADGCAGRQAGKQWTQEPDTVDSPEHHANSCDLFLIAQGLMVSINTLQSKKDNLGQHPLAHP